jgi:hypothetical protein
VRPVLVVCLFALALGACDRSSSQTTSSTASTTSPVPAPAGPCPTFHGTTARAESVGSRPLGLLIDATAGIAGCLDQVTFTFRPVGGVIPPGYLVEYQDPPFSDGDPPREVSLDGEAFLSVVISPAASVDVTVEDQPQTYLGNLLLQYGEHNHLVLVRKFDDSLGAVRWVIALDAKRPFVVDSATDPTRLTVYIG